LLSASKDFFLPSERKESFEVLSKKKNLMD